MRNHYCVGNFDCEIYGMVFMKSAWNMESEIFEYKVCDRVFKRKLVFKSHLQVKHGVSTFECKVCDRVFNRILVFKSHLQGKHGVSTFDYQAVILMFKSHIQCLHNLGYVIQTKVWVSDSLCERVMACMMHVHIMIQRIYVCVDNSTKLCMW